MPAHEASVEAQRAALLDRVHKYFTSALRLDFSVNLNLEQTQREAQVATCTLYACRSRRDALAEKLADGCPLVCTV